ncbi:MULTISPECIES: acetylxylan esterase [unclassified Crossiella]|uniref:acetylxylan esterase n=1 Tax=unclassified Crossiella TaxID=2620835 RepID=UPI001FFE9EB5|nr:MULTISPECIES: acetylxylan esterase [unclassified Crossiella]MCK2241940.1 acetylxylan esterase [Crossiella sp. S99.2]MCK2255843.1 acetylxylan esterase [Crossiella sp. S99.1]
MSEFDQYWRAVDEELAAVPAGPVLTEVPARSTVDFTAYDVHLTSIGPYRIFGFLSIPTGAGPFPAVLETPRYGSVNQPPHYRDRLRYLTFTVMHRGQRLADVPFQAGYPGLATLGIEDPLSYVYRGIVADCLRGAEFLRSCPEVDPARTAVTGDDLALLTAARRPGFAAVRSSGPPEVEQEIADRLHAYPEHTDRIQHTRSLFDPDRHAESITAATLRVGRDLQLSHRDAEDDATLDTWLAGQLGVAPMSKFGLVPR